MSTYLCCLAAYLTGWPIVQFIAWPWIHHNCLAAKEKETRLQVAEEMVRLISNASSENGRIADLEAINAELLAACKAMRACQYGEFAERHYIGTDVQAQADAAIAEAEGAT